MDGEPAGALFVMDTFVKTADANADVLLELVYIPT
jgi:hypothetical protein